MPANTTPPEKTQHLWNRPEHPADLLLFHNWEGHHIRNDLLVPLISLQNTVKICPKTIGPSGRPGCRTQRRRATFVVQCLLSLDSHPHNSILNTDTPTNTHTGLNNPLYPKLMLLPYSQTLQSTHTCTIFICLYLTLLRLRFCTNHFMYTLSKNVLFLLFTTCVNNCSPCL